MRVPFSDVVESGVVVISVFEKRSKAAEHLFESSQKKREGPSILNRKVLDFESVGANMLSHENTTDFMPPTLTERLCNFFDDLRWKNESEHFVAQRLFPAEF